MLEEEAVDRAIGHGGHGVREVAVGGKDSPEHGDGTRRTFRYELEDRPRELFVAYSWRRRTNALREEGLRPPSGVAGNVVADSTIRDPMASTVFVAKSPAFHGGQLFIGEGLDELEDHGVFLEMAIRQVLPIGFAHASDLLEVVMHAVYCGDSGIGIHDRLNCRHVSKPGPSQSSGARDTAARDPESSRTVVRNLFPQEAEDYEEIRARRECGAFSLARRGGEKPREDGELGVYRLRGHGAGASWQSVDRCSPRLRRLRR